ncbi:MAG: hypothetical protein RJB13_2439 [Pseudomonadota bacterium]
MLVRDLIAEVNTNREMKDDDSVVITDVRGSTQLGLIGRSREVNFVGAACISAVLDAFPKRSIPYVFGGDGATFVVAADLCTKVIELLKQVRSMARIQFGIDLRVGLVTVRELRDHGTEVRVSECFRGNATFYQFMGSGFSLADRLVKERSDISQVDASESLDSVKLTGLSCRLQPFQSLNGHIVTVVIESLLPVVEQDIIFHEILALLNVRLNLESVRPIQPQNMRRKWISRSFFIEAKAASMMQPFFQRIRTYWDFMIAIFLTSFVFKIKKYSQTTGNVEEYEKALMNQNDWIKIGGLFTLILDLSADDSQYLESLLESYESKGLFIFGCHRSSEAVMLCQVVPNEPTQHIHFVDGSDCGLAMAAAVLKKKRAQGLQNFRRDELPKAS